MRDGVDLIADRYEPSTTKPAGTLLVRGPYGRGWPFSVLFAGVYASRGYHVVVQSVRGTFGSGGEFSPMVHEIADGADTAGCCATNRGSPDRSPPSACPISASPSGPADRPAAGDDGRGHHRRPARSQRPALGYGFVRAQRLPRLERHGRPPGGTQDHRRCPAGAGPTGARQRDQRAAGRRGGPALLGTGAPWYESWLEHPEHDDPHWAPLQLHQALERTQIPVLLLGGWRTCFSSRRWAQYQRLRERGVPVTVTIGPWTHTQVMTKGAPTVIRESLGWLDAHLAGTRSVARKPVRIHVNGHGWAGPAGLAARDARAGAVSAAVGPARRHRARRGHAGAELHLLPPPTRRRPSAAGCCHRRGATANDTRLAQRADVLTFTGAPLPADLYVVGTPLLQLSHSCDNPYNDLFVRLSQVDERGPFPAT